MNLSTNQIAERTGLSADQVRKILSAYATVGTYGLSIWRKQSWYCTEAVFEELFGAIVAENQRRLQAEAEQRVIEANAVIERKRIEAEIRRSQAEARRDATLNTARSRLKGVTRRRYRKAAHYRLAVAPEYER